MPQGMTEVERRNLKHSRKSMQIGNLRITARIPLQSRYARQLPPGGSYRHSCAVIKNGLPGVPAGRTHYCNVTVISSPTLS